MEQNSELTATQQWWADRQVERYKAGEVMTQEYLKGLEQSFQQAQSEVESLVNKFLVKYGPDITYVDTQRGITQKELKELLNYLDRYGNRRNLKSTITRLDSLLKQINAVLDDLYSGDYEKGGKEVLKSLYEQQYHMNWYNIDSLAGLHYSFSTIDPNTIYELIAYPFNGANYSDRLWIQKADMIKKLKESLVTMFTQGKHPRTLSAEFAKTFERKTYEAYRLLNTESTFISEQASLRSYSECGIDEYNLINTLDTRTSEICRSLDTNKAYKVSEAVTGVNYPPFHWLCRTTTGPAIDKKGLTKLARDKEGNNIEVPADITYQEWYDKYIVGK